MENQEEKKTVELSAEDKAKLEKAWKEANKPQVVKSLDMRPRETDIRELSAKDHRQLMYRESRDTNAYLKFMNMGVNDIAMTLLVIAEHMGIDVTAEVEKKRLALMEQMQKEQKKPESN